MSRRLLPDLDLAQTFVHLAIKEPNLSLLSQEEMQPESRKMLQGQPYDT